MCPEGAVSCMWLVKDFVDDFFKNSSENGSEHILIPLPFGRLMFFSVRLVFVVGEVIVDFFDAFAEIVNNVVHIVFPFYLLLLVEPPKGRWVVNG